MAISVINHRDHVELVAEGRLTGDSIADLRKTSLVQMDTHTPPRMILNLEAVTLIDSCALGLIASIHRAAALRGGRFSVINAREAVQNVFRISKLDRVLELSR